MNLDSCNPDSWNCRTTEIWWNIYMYIARIQIHGTAELCKLDPCICILHESRFMELQNYGNLVTHIYVYSMNPDSWNCRTMDTWPMHVYLYSMNMYIAWIHIHGTAELWKFGEPCMFILHESRFMELQNYGNVVKHIWKAPCKKGPYDMVYPPKYWESQYTLKVRNSDFFTFKKFLGQIVSILCILKKKSILRTCGIYWLSKLF